MLPPLLLVIPYLYLCCPRFPTFPLPYYNFQASLPAYILHPFQPRDTLIFTPLILPAISSLSSAFSVYDLPRSTSTLFCAARSPLYFDCWYFPLFLLLRSSYLLSILYHSSSSSLLQSAWIYLRSATFLAPLAFFALRFYRIGSALVPPLGLAQLGFAQFR